MAQLSNGEFASPITDVLIGEFSWERPDLAADPMRREGLYQHASGLYYLVRWKPDNLPAMMMQRGGAPPIVANLDCREISVDEARGWLDRHVKWARHALGAAEE